MTYFTQTFRPSLIRRVWTFYQERRVAFRVFQWWITLILYGVMAVAWWVSGP